MRARQHRHRNGAGRLEIIAVRFCCRNCRRRLVVDVNFAIVGVDGDAAACRRQPGNAKRELTVEKLEFVEEKIVWLCDVLIEVKNQLVQVAVMKRLLAEPHIHAIALDAFHFIAFDDFMLDVGEA